MMSSSANDNSQARRQTARRGRPFVPLQSRSIQSRGRQAASRGRSGSNSQPSRTSTRQSASAASATENGTTDDTHCIICMDDITQPRKLSCGHSFCTSCITEYFRRCQEKCPTCGKVIGVLRGNQPPGKFAKSIIQMSLPGHECYKTIQITYTIPNGIQTVRFILDQ